MERGTGSRVGAEKWAKEPISEAGVITSRGLSSKDQLILSSKNMDPEPVCTVNVWEKLP